MEYYSTIKRNEIGSFVETWVEPEPSISEGLKPREVRNEGQLRDPEKFPPPTIIPDKL